jgi:hypothetical protein
MRLGDIEEYEAWDERRQYENTQSMRLGDIEEDEAWDERCP